jgi:succinate dehydrogenase/fumarate reductase flavoprotein subunit
VRLGKNWDVIVVGAGNAAFCAALAAREKGARVLMLERAPQELSGGNSRFTAGAMIAGKLEGVDAKAFLEEVRAYNAAVDQSFPFDPNVKDGRCTRGLAVNKSKWANTLTKPPFEAYQVGCGITFTFSGLRIDPDTGAVLDTDMAPISGLHAAGELVGGIFYFNYPGGTGLTSGAVFGRIAGTAAGALAGNA